MGSDPQHPDVQGSEAKSARASDPDTPEPISVGNDVVDLSHPRCRKRPSVDPLLRRILTPGEGTWLERGGPDELRLLRLWTLWAAKEAAYKVRCRLERGTRAFRPREFSCELRVTMPEGEHQGAGALAERTADAMTIFRVEGRVLSGRPEKEVLVEGTSDGSFVHIVGCNGGPLRPGTRRLEVGLERLVPGGSDAHLERMREHFTAEEWEGVHSLPSALVRLFARARLTSRLGGRNEAVPLPRVEILTGSARSAPRVRIAGRDCPDLSVSLSHHGRYVAWAMLSRVSLDNLRARAGIA